MIFGGKWTGLDKCTIKTKIDDNFSLYNSFQMDLSKNV